MNTELPSADSALPELPKDYCTDCGGTGLQYKNAELELENCSKCEGSGKLVKENT